MKFGKLLLVGAAAFLTFTASAQDDDEQKRECDRMRLFAGERGLKVEDYKAASMYLLKAETICGSLDKDNWDRLIGSLKNVVYEEADEATKKLYADTLIKAYERQEAAGFYLESEDLQRGGYYMMLETPDAAKADFYFQRGIAAAGTETDEAYLVNAYYTTYLLYYAAQGEEQDKLKQRMIDDYFRYSEIIAKAGMTPQTQETLTTYLQYAIQSCEALLPMIPNYITNLPEDKEAAVSGIRNMIALLEQYGCTETDEHKSLAEAWMELEPESPDAIAAMLIHLSPSKAIPLITTLIDNATDAEEKAGLIYQKAVLQLKAGQYKAAYATGKSCTGKYSADGLYIAAKAVAATANGCGDSTFERKCNFIYAAQLAEQAGQGGAAASYRASGPTSQDCFTENSPTSVTLSCWGVTVNPCP